jgi:L-asparaginase
MQDAAVVAGDDGEVAMNRPRIAIASLGGTITMTAESRSGAGVRPALGAEALIDAVPALSDIARIQARTLATKPGASLTSDDLLEALRWADERVSSGAAGVVLVQGTDTIEEAAYLLDLHWARSEPLVVTGAMRPPQVPGADGPANLLAAVATAAETCTRDRGVMVVMNDEIHAAARVRKTNTSSVGAFRSVPFGPLGTLAEGRVAVPAPPPDRSWFPAPATLDLSGTALVEVTMDDDGALLPLIVDAGYSGIVVAGFGVGHVSHRFADAMKRAAPTVPVVLASRTGSGTTYAGTYGFTGSERDLLEHGAIAAGWLDARKARILLASATAAGLSRQGIADEFRLRGSGSATPAAHGVDALRTRPA